MNTPRIRCVALDFDLTLFDYAKPGATRAVFPWLETLAEQGVLAGIASGRSIESLKMETSALGMAWAAPFPAFVIEHECLLRSPSGGPFPGTRTWNESVLAEKLLLEEKAVPLLEQIRGQADAEGVRVVRDILLEPGNASLCLETPADAERARQRLVARTTKAGLPLEIRRNHHILLLSISGRNKGSALEVLRRALSLQACELLVIGDNLNDLSMMHPGLGFQCATVGNAEASVAEAVRSRGGLVAKASASAGVIELFTALFPDFIPHKSLQADPEVLQT